MASASGEIFSLLFYGGIIAGVVAAIVHSNRKDREIKQSPLYAEWYWYYVDNGYTSEQAQAYAKVQTKNHRSLADYNTKLKVGKDGRRSYVTLNGDDPAETKPYPSTYPSGAGASGGTPAKKMDSGEFMTNLILGVAGFLLSGGMIFMVNEMNAALVAPIFITIVLVFYATGAGLYAKVKHLRAVGLTFLITALVLGPFCYIAFLDAFKSLRLAGAVSGVITSILCLGLYAYAAWLTKSKLAGVVSFAWPYILLWSLADIVGFGDMPIAMYWICLTPFLVSIPCAIIWSRRVKIPVCYRAGCKGASYIAIGLNLAILAGLVMAPDAQTDFAFLRTVVAILIFVQTLLVWLGTKAFRDMVWMRFLGQLAVLMLCADCLNYSMFINTPNSNKTFAAMMMSIIWAGTFFIQAIVSLFIKKTEKSENAENVIGAVSLVGIGSTFFIASSLSKPEIGIITTTVLGLVAVLGVLYGVVKKNSTWAIATAISLVAIPIAVSLGITQLDNVLLVILYTILSVLAAAGFAFLRSINDKHQLTAPLVLMGLSALIALCAAADENIAGYAIIPQAISYLVIAVLYNGKDKRTLRESAIYTTAWAGVLFLDTFLHEITGCRTEYLRCSDAILDVQKFIQAHIIGGAFILSSYLYDKRGKGDPRTRLIWGYVAYTFGGALIAIFARTSSNNLTYGIIYLLEQAAILAIVATIQIKWLAISSGVALGIGAIYISDMYKSTYIWMIGIALLLIGVAIWRLTTNKKTPSGDGELGTMPMTNTTGDNTIGNGSNDEPKAFIESMEEVENTGFSDGDSTGIHEENPWKEDKSEGGKIDDADDESEDANHNEDREESRKDDRETESHDEQKHSDEHHNHGRHGHKHHEHYENHEEHEHYDDENRNNAVDDNEEPDEL